MMKRKLLSRLHEDRSCESRQGFTLVELLTVIAIIGVLASLLLPAIQAAREAARRMQCSSQLRQMAIALANYEYAYKHYPAGSVALPPPRQNQRFLWSGALLPFIEQYSVMNSIDFDQPWDVPGTSNYKALQTRIPLFVCPSSNSPQRYDHVIEKRMTCTYLACASGLTARETGPDPIINDDECDGIFFTNSYLSQNAILDGTSQTVFIGETLFLKSMSGVDNNGNSQLCDHWSVASPTIGVSELSEAYGSTACRINSWLIEPQPFIEDIELGYASRHHGGAHVVFADAHILFVSQSVDAESWSAMGTRFNNDTVSDE